MLAYPIGYVHVLLLPYVEMGRAIVTRAVAKKMRRRKGWAEGKRWGQYLRSTRIPRSPSGVYNYRREEGRDGETVGEGGENNVYEGCGVRAYHTPPQ